MIHILMPENKLIELMYKYIWFTAAEY